MVCFRAGQAGGCPGVGASDLFELPCRQTSSGGGMFGVQCGPEGIWGDDQSLYVVFNTIRELSHPVSKYRM